MEAVRQTEWTSVGDYLAAEERSEVRHEYIAGAIYAMAGASDEHIAIGLNIAVALRNHLKGASCRVQVFDGKVRLRVGSEDIFYYPDVMVARDARDTDRYFKRFPKVLVEVLSETTEATDRREKFLSYRQIETLEEYVLVAQDKTEVTVFQRANNWQAQILRQRQDVLRFASLNFSLSLEAVYEGVEF
jgi:Uma2 family endonuclease